MAPGPPFTSFPDSASFEMSSRRWRKPLGVWGHHPGSRPSSGFGDGSGSALGVPSPEPGAGSSRSALSPGAFWAGLGLGRSRVGQRKCFPQGLASAALWATREGAGLAF